MFDPNLYAQLVATSPAAADSYLASFQAPAAAPAPVVPQAQFQQPNIQQGFAQQAAQPQQQAARGTLEDFFNQPSGGGASVTSKFFKDRPQGSWLQMTVLADVSNADVQHQKTPQGVLQFFKKNGQDDLSRPKLVLVVKVQVTGSSDGSHAAIFPNGEASLWLKKGPVTDDLIRAMTGAGDPSGYPKAGAQMVMQSAGEKVNNNGAYSPTKLYTFQYAAPAGVPVENPTTPIPSATAPAPGPVPATPAVPVTAAPVPSASPTLPAPATGAAPVPVVATLPTTPVAAAPISTPPAPVPTVPTAISTPTAAPAAAAPSPTVASPVTPPVPEAAFNPPPAVPNLGGETKEQLLARLQGASS